MGDMLNLLRMHNLLPTLNLLPMLNLLPTRLPLVSQRCTQPQLPLWASP